MEKLQLWRQKLAEQPRLVDLLLTVTLIAVNLGFLTGPISSDTRPVDLWAVMFVTAPNLCILFRRRYPSAMLAIATLFGYAYWGANYPDAGAAFTILTLVFFLPIYAQSRKRATLTQIVFFGSLAFFLGLGLLSDSGNLTLGTALINLLLFQLTWSAGDYFASRRKEMRTLRDQVQHAEEEQRRLTKQAVVAEQTRIARELHDVVAHSMSVVIVQSNGAKQLVGRDDEAVARALDAIGTTGRQTLGDIRGIVGLLREDDRPTPDISAIAQLVDESQASGLATSLSIEGTRRDLPLMIELSAYRVVQESLTNCRKHAGPLATAEVTVNYTDEALAIEVQDDGRGKTGDTATGGFGLIGMKERVETFGGTFHQGPRPGGGYRIRVTLPIEGPDQQPQKAETPGHIDGGLHSPDLETLDG